MATTKIMEKIFKIEFEDKEDYVQFCDGMTLTDREHVEISLNKNKKICCKKPMIDLGDISQLPIIDIIKSHTWVCGQCGSVQVENTCEYDDEELFNLMDCYSDKFKDTPIYKKLKEQMGED